MTTRPTTNAKTKDAADRTTKGSVHEAIGMLMGDDAARERGKAQKRAGKAAEKDARSAS